MRKNRARAGKSEWSEPESKIANVGAGVVIGKRSEPEPEPEPESIPNYSRPKYPSQAQTQKYTYRLKT